MTMVLTKALLWLSLLLAHSSSSAAFVRPTTPCFASQQDATRYDSVTLHVKNRDSTSFVPPSLWKKKSEWEKNLQSQWESLNESIRTVGWLVNRPRQRAQVSEQHTLATELTKDVTELEDLQASSTLGRQTFQDLNDQLEAIVELQTAQEVSFQAALDEKQVYTEQLEGLVKELEGERSSVRALLRRMRHVVQRRLGRVLWWRQARRQEE